MRRAIDHGVMPAAGFVEPWSICAGGSVALHLSCEDTAPDVRIVQLDTSPNSPCDWPVRAESDVGGRDIVLGSWLEIETAGDAVEELSFELLLTRNSGERTILSRGDAALYLTPESHVTLCADDVEAKADAPLSAETWHCVVLRFGEDEISCEIVRARGGPTTSLAVPRSAGAASTILLGRGRDDRLPTLNARFARPALRLSGGGHAAWNIPPRGPLSDLVPSSGADVALRFHGNPTFAVTSARWDGTTFDPRHMPEHYDAVHVHDDDLASLEWPATHTVTVPAEAAPGVYAFEVATRRGTERIPFFVRGACPAAPLVFLVPTATYLAYADEYLAEALYPWVVSDRAHLFAQANGLKSQYDFHSDASGVTISSLRRPKATVRDDYTYPLCGCAHNLPVDLNLLRFCRQNGIRFDLLTDHDLDREGAEALTPFRALMTGSHPEYWSIPMEDALRGFLDGGGNLAYLGGNGFDTVVAFRADLMELRRGRTPSHRTWDMRPGELHLAMTGEPGGPLRERGRGEHRLTGVGITLMGFGPSRPYRRTEESRDVRYGWLFEGVPDVFGEGGMVLGGAAGYEVDCTDRRLGTPEDTVVLARADGFGEEFIGDAGRWYEGGEPERAESRKAEMTIREHPGGGTVFAASSVAWCGALPVDAPLNGVGALTRNLLKHLSADKGERFEHPARLEGDASCAGQCDDRRLERSVR